MTPVVVLCMAEDLASQRFSLTSQTEKSLIYAIGANIFRVEKKSFPDIERFFRQSAIHRPYRPGRGHGPCSGLWAAVYDTK